MTKITFWLLPTSPPFWTESSHHFQWRRAHGVSHPLKYFQNMKKLLLCKKHVTHSFAFHINNWKSVALRCVGGKGLGRWTKGKGKDNKGMERERRRKGREDEGREDSQIFHGHDAPDHFVSFYNGRIISLSPTKRLRHWELQVLL